MEEVTRHSFLVITENHRLLELPFIFDAFEEAYYESKRILKATVTTVVPLHINLVMRQLRFTSKLIRAY
jgi:F0F1-type ATP synthase delta subunit